MTDTNDPDYMPVPMDSYYMLGYRNSRTGEIWTAVFNSHEEVMVAVNSISTNPELVIEYMSTTPKSR